MKHGPAIQTGSSLGAWPIFLIFLRLGLSAFGGPVAHLAYFRNEFVVRRGWLDDAHYTDLVALCQFLPGPTSSQVGMALGLQRGGWPGLLAAWCGFTLPSAALLILVALGLAQTSSVAASGALHGLKLVAVAIVAQALWGMARGLCPDRARAALALLASLLTLALPTASGQIGVLLLAGLIGWCWLPATLPISGAINDGRVSRCTGALALTLFLALLGGLSWWALLSQDALPSLLAGVYRAGALVFGGGHVVLPLLQTSVASSGLIGEANFLAGYSAAQAVPGPLFTFAAYLGAVAPAPLGGWFGGMVLLILIFLPATLILIAALPFWEQLRQRRAIQRAMAGINAAVVGILLATLYDPIWTSAIHHRTDFALALSAFGMLVLGRISPGWVVVLAAAIGSLRAILM